MAKRKSGGRRTAGLAKCRTGIVGLDEITEGGLPRGRPTLVCGGTGCGKTLLAMEFLVRGAVQFGEPGVFMAFEENAEELADNVASLGFDLRGLIRRKKLAIDFVRIERSEIQETGEYDLEGLFVRLNSMIKSIGARRVVLDTVEALFAGIPDEGVLRAELRRLFRWLKDNAITAVITGERGEKALTRHGLEEYISDCVILLDHRVSEQVATRRLRIVKYRGSSHGTNEYPTLIDTDGLSVLPISALGLTYPVSDKRVCTGIGRLDEMLGGKGYYRGSSVLVSGTAGSGKTSIAAAFVDAACRRGERCLYFSYEESPEQVIRNMRSIGMDLRAWVRKDLLRFHSLRPSLFGLEMHLAVAHKLTKGFAPAVVVMDPVTNMMAIGDASQVKAMLTRLIDFLKNLGITAIFTSLTGGGDAFEQSEVGISSLMDTWLLLRMVESQSERNRILYILKSRGMSHSNQMREFVLSDAGISLVDVYVGPGAVFTGTARLNQEALDKAAAVAARGEAARRKRLVEEEVAAAKAQIGGLRARIAALEAQAAANTGTEMQWLAAAEQGRAEMAHARG